MPTATSTPPPKLEPLRLEIVFPTGRTFKSVSNLTWENIPPLAVLTGKNGVGKTQFLELLAFRLSGANHFLPDANQVKVTVSDPAITPGTVAFLPNTWNISGGSSVSMGGLSSWKEGLWNQIKPEQNQKDIRHQNLRYRVAKALNRENLNGLTPESFKELLPDDFSFMLDDSDVNAGLAHVFMGYRFHRLQELEKGTPEAEIRNTLGPAPWLVLNEVLKVADFPYEVISPVGIPLLDTYKIELVDRASGVKINPGDLSSGEKMLLRVVMWLYGSQHHQRFPRLMLLDEPDAHLHPSMTGVFLHVLQQVLVEKYGVRVIMSTHSPSTVALAPEGSIFEMVKANPRIRPSTRENAIGILTAGLVTVAPGSRFVLVEDENDVEFYNAIRDLLTDYGPSKDPRALAPSPTIAFLPASVGKKKEKVSGGNSVVKGWVEKLNEPPLAEIFRGIIDQDSGNAETPRISVLGRYSFENYLVDPFVIYAHLLAQGKAPPIAGMVISPGEEHRIRTLSQVQLQQIVDAIAKPIEIERSKSGAVDNAEVPVVFTNGLSVNYPKWMITTRGHDLLPIFQKIFGNPTSFSPPILIQVMRRVRLLPVELADILHRIQTT